MPHRQSVWEMSNPKETLSFLRLCYSETEARHCARRQLRKSTHRRAIADIAFWVAVMALLLSPRGRRLGR